MEIFGRERIRDLCAIIPEQKNFITMMKKTDFLIILYMGWQKMRGGISGVVP